MHGQEKKEEQTHINQNPLIRFLIRAWKAYQLAFLRRAAAVAGDLQLRAAGVELGAAHGLRGVQRDDLIPEEIVARFEVCRDGDARRGAVVLKRTRQPLIGIGK